MRMNFIFLGPPGAGKGTLAGQVAEEYGLPHISTGDIFREAIKNQTPLGVKVKGIIDAGGLVSDDITCALVDERLKKNDCKKGFGQLNSMPPATHGPQMPTIAGLITL